jgi:hypothetical protein
MARPFWDATVTVHQRQVDASGGAAGDGGRMGRGELLAVSG